MSAHSSNYPIPVSPPQAAGVHRPPNQPIRGDTRLCSVIEHIAEGDPRARSALHGLPWFTPIVGSGCLQLGDGPTIDLEALGRVADAEMHRLLGTAAHPGAVPYSLLAMSFARALHRSRTHGDVAVGGVGVAPSAAAARLTVLTALLTRLYHLVAKDDPTPLSWFWGSEQIPLGEDPSSIGDGVLPVARVLLERMRDGDVDSFQVPPAVLLDRVWADLIGRQTLSVSDLRLLTELTWIELIRGTPIYPGWSDLLLELLVELASDDGVFQGYRPQIRRLHRLDESVSRLLTQPTWRSWRTRTESDGSPDRDRFYDAVARLLQAQADIHALLHPEERSDSADDDDEYAEVMRARVEAGEVIKAIVSDTNRKLRVASLKAVPAEGLRIPHPAAYVTSFDLELEMALWSAGRPFRIVLPVLAQSKRRMDPELVWLTTVLDRTKDEDLACYPFDEEPTRDDGPRGADRRVDLEGHWRSLRALRAAARPWQVAQLAVGGPAAEAGGWCPIVVRVTGSPLMVLPTITGSLRAEMMQVLGYQAHETLEMTHALTIDEYTSLRQSEHELFFAARREPRALPPPLTLGFGDGFGDMERVWVGFGVQVDDPAIRMRMFTQLSAASIVKRLTEHARSATDGADGSGHSLRVHGLAVNRRLDENQSTALQWLGFKFTVDDSVAKIIPDIEHCGRHYEHVAQTLRNLKVEGPPKEGGQEVDIDWGRPWNDRCRMWNIDHRSKTERWRR